MLEIPVSFIVFFNESLNFDPQYFLSLLTAFTAKHIKKQLNYFAAVSFSKSFKEYNVWNDLRPPPLHDLNQNNHKNLHI